MPVKKSSKMKVKSKRTLKNGAVAGYVYYSKEKKWKWRIIGRDKKQKGGMNCLFVPQKEIKFAKSDKCIGSLGAVPCTIFCIFHNKIGTLCGHIDAVTKMNFINDYLNIFISLLKNKNISLEDVSIILTDSGDSNNEILRNKIINECLEKKNLSNIKIVPGTALIVKADTGYYSTDFDIKLFGNMSENIKNIIRKRNEALKKFNNARSIAEKYRNSHRHLYPHNEWSRPPKPNSSNDWWFNFSNGSWKKFNKKRHFKTSRVKTIF